MPIFEYEAIDHTGKIRKGRFSADIINDVEKWLMKNGMSPINIETLTAGEGLGAASEEESGRIPFFDRLRGVSLEDHILFCRQIATMLGAGVPILQSLEIMAKQVANPVLKQTVTEVAEKIEGGASLSESFNQYPKIFSQLFLNVITIGEESGTLDRSFNYLAALYENEKDVRERIKAATRYPKIVIGAMFVAVFILMTFVVPNFIELFASSKVALPLPTRILIAMSSLFAGNTLTIIVVIVLLITSYRMCLNYEGFVLFRDRLLLRMPIFGDLSIKIYMSRFCRVFSILTESGINIIKTLQLSSSALTNRVLYDALEEVTEEVEEGVDLNSAMSRHPQFPVMVVQMVAVGEESGQLDTMMGRVADYFEVETEYTIKNLSTLIEPILLLFMGVMVAFIALSIFLPMWSMMSVMRG